MSERPFATCWTSAWSEAPSTSTRPIGCWTPGPPGAGSLPPVLQRKPDGEPAPRAGVLHRDVPVVGLGDPSGDGEPEPRSRVGARGSRGMAPKRHLEHSLQ